MRVFPTQHQRSGELMTHPQKALFRSGVFFLNLSYSQQLLSSLSRSLRTAAQIVLMRMWTILIALLWIRLWISGTRARIVGMLIVLLVGCGAAGNPSLTTPINPVPIAPTHASNSSAERWLTDGTRRLSAEAGSIRGVVGALDERMHPHFVYQTSIEWMEEKDEGGVIVTGTTPAGDRYERRLWTAKKGYATNGIGVRDDRIIVTAGTTPPERRSGLVLLIWQSRDGGKTWGDPIQSPFGSNAYQADVSWTPDGRAVLVASINHGNELMQTQIAVEQSNGQWHILSLFPSVRGGNYHTVWMRDTTDLEQGSLPALVVVASREGGFMVGRSTEGTHWDTITVTSVTAYTPRLIAADGTLFITHHTYGQAGLWIGRSDDGGMSWTVTSAFTGILDSPTNGISVENAQLLWDSYTQRLFMVVVRFDRTARVRRIVVLSAARDQVLAGDAAWMPDIVEHPWMPITLSATHTDQIRPFIVQRGAIALAGWEGWYFPRDRHNATDADFRSSSEPSYAVIRVANLTEAWMAEQNRGTR